MEIMLLDRTFKESIAVVSKSVAIETMAVTVALKK